MYSNLCCKCVVLWSWKCVGRGEKPRIVTLRGLLAFITRGGELISSSRLWKNMLGATYVNPWRSFFIKIAHLYMADRLTFKCIMNWMRKMLTWNTLFADSLKVHSTGESIGADMVNFWSNCDTSSSLVSFGLNGGSNFRDITSSQLICLKNLWDFTCSPSIVPDPSLCPTCLCKETLLYTPKVNIFMWILTESLSQYTNILLDLLK